MEEPHKPINYEFLRKLVNIDGLSNVLQKHSTPEAHTAVMSNYHDIFIEPELPAHLPPVHTQQRMSEKASLRVSGPRESEEPRDQLGRSCGDLQKPLLAIEYPQHDIRQFTRQAHATNKAALPKPGKSTRLQALRQLLQKPQYQRNSDDNEQLYRQLRHFDTVRSQVGSHLLRQMASVAKFERWPEGDVTLLAHGSLFLLLRGSVTAMCQPMLRDVNEDEEQFFEKCRPLSKEEQFILRPGEIFGTLNFTEQPHDASKEKILAVHLAEDGVEFLKISAFDYERIKQQTESKDEIEKSNLLKENPSYALWSAQPLMKVARRIEWLNVPANTVIVSEGFRAPFIAYIKSGSCRLLRKLQVNKTLKNGKDVQRVEQIVMGSIGQRQSFGEASLLNGEDMPCSLIADCDVVLAVLRPERLEELDQDTRMLIGQSADEAMGTMSLKEVEKEYVIQESAKEWNETKQAVVLDVINARGIIPGVGKWAK